MKKIRFTQRDFDLLPILAELLLILGCILMGWFWAGVLGALALLWQHRDWRSWCR